MRNSVEFILWFIGLVFAQVLLFNNIQIAGLINPFPYIYIILALPTKINRMALLFIGFLTGFTIDVFSNTWGIHAAATTLVAYLRPYLFGLVTTQEDREKIFPLYSNMGSAYIKYAVLVVFIHHCALFCLEAFSLYLFWMVMAKAIVSSVVTLALIFVLERIR